MPVPVDFAKVCVVTDIVKTGRCTCKDKASIHRLLHLHAFIPCCTSVNSCPQCIAAAVSPCKESIYIPGSPAGNPARKYETAVSELNGRSAMIIRRTANDLRPDGIAVGIGADK